MAILNPSFETPEVVSGVDVDSLPADWSKSAAAVGHDAATFGPPYEWAETFEALWDGNEDAISAFVPITHLVDADFGTSPLQTIYDSFEHLWPDNEDAYSAFESGNLTDGVFGSAADDHDSFGVEWPARHPVADTTRYITDTFITSNPATVHSRLNELKADFNLHGADATVHTAADVTNVIGSPNASDLASSILLATELWDECWAHIVDASLTWHLADAFGSLQKPSGVGFYAPSTYANCADLANELTVGLDLHLTWADASGPGGFSAYDETLTDIFAYPMPMSIGAGAFEDFETDWQNNQTAYVVFVPITHLVDADLTTDGAPNDYESFETELTLQVLAAPGFGTPLDIDPTNGVRVTVSGAFAATLILQVRRSGSTTWLDWDTTTAPGDMDVDAGYAEVRMHTFAYTSGAPAAKLKWRPIETL